MWGNDRVRAALLSSFPEALVDDLLSTFNSAVEKHNAGDFDTCLVKAGLFSEHVIRALILESTSSLPDEIKNFSQAVQTLSKAVNLPESARILIPRILASSAYDMRSKRGAVHVKGVNPRKRDATQALGSMAWTLAELLSLYGDLEGYELDSTISTVMRRTMPHVEHVGGQFVVTAEMPAHLETLLIIDSHPEGVSRRSIGKLVKRSPSSVTHALTKLSKERMAHQNSNGLWFITGKGESVLQAIAQRN
ncbi:hypothetical protein [Parasphingopyxis sp.]|uniref:hypothetical protein n=1 Tax=Parasphingopyxis sp. TaxID=1920299 RepID=UPI00262F8201|nr:hypothetical protein [Parasphingopyxis sp.]